MNITTNEDLIAAKTRLTNAKAEQAEIKLALMKAEAVKLSEVNLRWGEQASRVKTKLLAIPARAAPQLSGQELSTQEVNKILTEVISEALNELAESFGEPEE